ncbi:hypothetical protein Tco_1161819 [Tanacetum coccineum]
MRTLFTLSPFIEAAIANSIGTLPHKRGRSLSLSSPPPSPPQDTIDEATDHMDELPLERAETMQQELDGLCTRVKTTQRELETLRGTLGATHEKNSVLESRLDKSEVREIKLGAIVRALEDRFGPVGM